MNNELNFLKDYFFKNNKKNGINYNNIYISKIRRELFKLLKDIEKDFDNEEEFMEKFDNYDEKENFARIDSKKQIIDKKNALINKIYKFGYDYIIFSRKIKFIDNNQDANNTLMKLFKNFFMELFKNNL